VIPGVAAVREALAGRAHRPAAPGQGDRFAAVAAILREGAAGAEVLLIRRASHPRDPWSGQMAFPGGRHDPTDPDLVATAMRETAEEVGLALDREGTLVGRLDDLPAVARGRRAGLVIAPFVFQLAGPEPPELRPAPGEVAEVLWAPLGPLLRGERDATYPYEHEGRHIPLPAYDVDGRIVWGLTHRMLSALFEILDGRARDGY